MAASVGWRTGNLGNRCAGSACLVCGSGIGLPDPGRSGHPVSTMCVCALQGLIEAEKIRPAVLLLPLLSGRKAAEVAGTTARMCVCFFSRICGLAAHLSNLQSVSLITNWTGGHNPAGLGHQLR